MNTIYLIIPILLNVLVRQSLSQEDDYCDQPVDIAVLLDSSFFIGRTKFADLKSFAKTLPTYFDLSPNGLAPHLAFVPYGDKVSPVNINFRYSSSLSRLANTIDQRILYSGNHQSRLDFALRYAVETLFRRNKGARSWVPRVVLAITGSVRYWGEEKNGIKQYAQLLQQRGIQLIIASIGEIKQSNKIFLESVVPSRDHLYLVRYVYGLSQIAEKIVRQVCPVPSTFSCPAVVDLVFIVDSSGSISTANYNKMKYFMYSIANALNISESGTHAAVVIYSDVAEVAINFNDHKDISSFREAVYILRHMKDYTRIDLGLNAAYSKIFASSDGGSRPHAKKIAFILTDGQQSTDKNGFKASVGEAARPLIESGIRTISIGIGSDVDNKELRSMVVRDGDVIIAPNFDELTKRIQNISQFTCEAVGPSSSICENVIDIAFILDSSGSINLEEFSEAKKSILAIANTFVISASNTRVALMIYSSEARIMSKFGKILSQKDLWSELQDLPHLRGKTRIDLALRLAAAKLFTVNGGMRLTSSKVAIVITDGRQSPAADAIRLDEAAVPLLVRGVKILSIGVGDRIDKHELEMMVKKPDSQVFLAESYSTLGGKTTDIANEACN